MSGLIVFAEQAGEGVTRYTFGENRYFYEHHDTSGVKMLFDAEGEYVWDYRKSETVEKIFEDSQKHALKALGEALEYHVRITSDPRSTTPLHVPTVWQDSKPAISKAEELARANPEAYVSILVEPRDRARVTHKLLGSTDAG